MTGRQACHRVIALSRRDQDRERILVLPRLYTSPLVVTTVVVILDLRKVSVSSELKSYASESTTNYLSFLKWEPAPLSFLLFHWLE